MGEQFCSECKILVSDAFRTNCMCDFEEVVTSGCCFIGRGSAGCTKQHKGRAIGCPFFRCCRGWKPSAQPEGFPLKNVSRAMRRAILRKLNCWIIPIFTSVLRQFLPTATHAQESPLFLSDAFALLRRKVPVEPVSVSDVKPVLWLYNA